MPLDGTAYLTPPAYAARLGCNPSKIIAAIRRGELAAIDTAEPGCVRPRFRISPQAIEDYERRRSVTPPIKKIPRRRHAGIESFL